jgi:prepilin-type N-terminal cleavage/methylation domain-containing protein
MLDTEHMRLAREYRECDVGRRLASPQPNRRSAFTLVEVLVATSMLALVAGTSFITLNRMNFLAFSSRLYSEAQAVAENQIDILLTKGPFDPTRTPALIPTELQVGATNQTGVLIYVDPVTGQTVVTGTMTTTISDPGLTQTINAQAANLNLRRIKVEVNYTFRNINYSVVMNSLRTADE